MTVTLRPFVATDAPWLDAWLPAVARSVGYDRLDVQMPSAVWAKARSKAPTVRIIGRDGESAGVLVYRIRTPRRDAAIIELVATPPDEARRGSGMQAAALVEAELRAAGVVVVYAPAPAVHGIAMYFWIRLGYRPLLNPEWPCETPGVAWLRRDL